MRKAANALFTIGGIFCIFGIILFLIFSLVFFAGGELVTSLLEEQGLEASIASICGVLFLILAIFTLIELIICFKCKKASSKGLHIFCIIFGAISGAYLPLIAGILATIADAREK